MKKFSFKIDTKKANIIADAEVKIFEEDGGKKIFENFIVQSLNQRFKDGIGGKKQRVYARLLDKLDASTDSTVTLDSDEYDFVKDLFTDESSRFTPGQTRVVKQYIYNIETATEV